MFLLATNSGHWLLRPRHCEVGQLLSVSPVNSDSLNNLSVVHRFSHRFSSFFKQPSPSNQSEFQLVLLVGRFWSISIYCNTIITNTRRVVQSMADIANVKRGQQSREKEG